MADTYNVNVTLDDFNSFITSEKVVDENNQELNDYVCNVTYTNLQNGQITAIGQEFANRLSDTDENGNPKTGLHKVALTGNYSQLDNKPSTSNLQGFHKVAFSGKVSDLTNDEGFLTEETDPIFTISPAANITNQDIINWNSKSNFDDSVLANIALSGSYNDLTNTPSYQTNQYNFSDVAFTGNFFDLENIPESLNGIIYFNSFINNTNATETNKILTLGDENVYILDFLNFQSDLGYLLSDAIMTMATNFLQSGKLYFFTNINRRYLITNIVRYLNNNNIETPAYVKMEYAISSIDNYESYSGNNFSDSIAATQLNNLTLSQKTGYLIFDYINNVIYCKVKNIT